MPRRLVVLALAVVVLVAALLIPSFGKFGLVPVGLLLAFSTDFGDAGPRTSVAATWRNLGLAAVMVAAFGWFWLWRLDLGASTLVAIAGVLLALPLALQELAGRGVEHRVALTRRSLIFGVMGLVTFAYIYRDRGMWFFALAAVYVVLPVVVAASRLWAARRGQLELGLLRYPLRPEVLHRGRGPARGVRGRPSAAALSGHQRGRGPDVRFPGLPARRGLRSLQRTGGAPLASDQGVVRAERR
jgi:hypothetical protein